MKIKVWKNDDWKTIDFPDGEQLPGIRNSCTIVPVSVVLRELGFKVAWNGGTLSIHQDNKTVRIYEKRSYFEMIETIDGESDHIRYDHTDKKEIDSPVVGGRLLTPIRDVLESLCYIVLWDDASKNVKIIPPAENKITVRFNYNYGIEKSSDKPYFERVSEGEAVTLPIPSRVGFVFDGWHIGRTDGTWVGDGKKSSTYYPTESVTLYAYWGRKYNITLVTNGGTVATQILRVDIGQSVQLPTPDRTGFTFEGWFLNSDFQGEPVNAEDYHPTDHVTLYAKWKSNGSKIILPYIINQNHNFNHNGENLNLVSKCAGVCAMDISLFYRNISFVGTDNEIESQLSNEMWNLYYCTHYEDPKKTSMFSGNALLWDNVYGVKFAIGKRNARETDFKKIFNLAVESIIAGRPMMIHCYENPYYGDKNYADPYGGKTHWVIPVSFTSEDKTPESLIVADPYVDTRNSYYLNDLCTLKSSFDTNLSGIDTIYFGYVTTEPDNVDNN